VRSTSSGTGSPEPRNAQGLFVEAGLRAGAYRHEFGAYSAEPNLRFGDAQLASDNRGAYWRVDTSGLRYAWGVGMDTDLQNPDREGGLPYARRLGINADGQYRLNRNNSFGGALQVSFNRFVAGSAAFGGVPLPQIDRESRSVYASGYYQTRFGNWGPTRLRGTLRRNEVLVANDIAATGQEIEWEQDWIIGRYETQRPELLTTLGVARDRSSGTSETQPTAGVSFRLWPTVDWDVSGSLRYISRDSNLSTSRGLSGTVSSEHVLPRGWRLGAAVSLNQAVVNVNGVAGLGISTVSRSNDKSAWLYLRWDGSSGTPYQVAGLRGAGGSVGGGSLQGFVFFDSNRDGEQQPGEGGVPAVEVFLDGRFRATTDRDGRFVFPLVATGAHQLTLTLETVPLPWGVAPEQGNVKVEVPLRGQATARIPVVRVGE
ncbi:MAG TPA: hypothetical protein VEY92_07130, partial [Pseudoxanthomonas sp.]|nr:hypothetical protein [Pseudoxanthomonas sp.]